MCRHVAAIVSLAVFMTAWSVETSRCAANDDQLVVLEEADRPLLYDYLLGEVVRQYDIREQAVRQALESPQSMAARREQLRSDYRKLIGDLPPRTPLNAETIGTIQCDGYRIEKVIYESRPHHHVTANLYLPDDMSKPAPGVLVPCGHSALAKAYPQYQSICVLLALNGCVALIYDPIGQGERYQLPDTVQHGTTEHTLVGLGALLVGRNTANYRIWDGLRSMDYLAGRPEVDPQRLGCTGNSGGGTMTTWLMAADDRIVAAAPACFITTIERLFKTIGPQDCEQHFPAQGARGIDHTDFITMRSPKPTLILAAEHDYFDFAGTQETYAQAKSVYEVLSHPDRVGLFSYADKHGFSQPRREAAAHWMRKWLADDDRTVREPTLTLQSQSDLQVTTSGQVISDFDDEATVIDFTADRARQLADSRQAAWKNMDARQQIATVRRILALPAKGESDIATRRQDTIARDGYTIEKLVIERAGQVPLPALLCVPDKAADGKHPAVVYADGRGKAADLQSGGPIEKLVADGRIVLAVDLRGYGETADKKEGGKYHNDEFRTAMVAMHVGRPLLGQRVEDLLAALRVVSEHPAVDTESVHLVGVGQAGPVALHAAAIEPRFASVTLRSSIGSWTDDVVARPLDPQLMGYVVPGALEHYDLPDLAAMLAGRLTVDPAE
jgi:cephalosporin-C deacetylase-like acetyl esterase